MHCALETDDSDGLCPVIACKVPAAQVRQCNAGLKHSEADYFDALAAGFGRLVAGTKAPNEAS